MRSYGLLTKICLYDYNSYREIKEVAHGGNNSSKVDGKRLKSAVEGLVSGDYTITVTRQDEDRVSGYVVNGEGKEYGVVLIGKQTFCGCPDAMFRGTVCKHHRWR